MKRITVVVREDDVDKLIEASKELPFPSTLEKELGRLTLFVPDSELDETIEFIRKYVDIRYKDNLIEVHTPDFIISSSLSKMDEKRTAEPKTPIEKLIDSTKPYSRLDMSKTILTIIAALIALTGLFTNNVEIIIGAMLLSPLLGPIYSFSINLGLGKVKNAVESITVLFVLVLSSLAIVTLITFGLGGIIGLPMTPEIISRTKMSPLYIPLGIMLGFATVLAMTKGIPEVFVGVAISVALLPPAVVAGIMLAIPPHYFVVPLIIVSQNILGMMSGSLLAVMILNIGPRKYYAKAIARKFIIRSAIIVVVLTIITFLPNLFIH